MGKTLLIEGSIAVGKSTFLEMFEETDNPLKEITEVIREPLDKWTNIREINLLQLFNDLPNRYGFAFQSYVYLTMVQNHTKPLMGNKQVRLLERSIYSAFEVFVRNLKENQFIRNVEYYILEEWYKQIIEKEIQTKPDYIIYLSASIATQLNRIRERGRPEEGNISENYLQKLNELYEEFIDKQINLKIPVLRIDTDKILTETHIDFKNSIYEITKTLQ